MKNYERRDKKLRKRKNGMRISGRGLLTVTAAISAAKTEIAKKRIGRKAPNLSR